ncbi:MAG TPA: hypothetical protein VES67_06060 [Vicinamibacterales bacterium]|nr:hypothetical protein [Vicinamibacterales bacterium]
MADIARGLVTGSNGASTACYCFVWMSSSNPSNTRIGLVGLGNAGFQIHLPSLAGMPSVTVTGACDPDAARRERAAAKYGVQG